MLLVAMLLPLLTGCFGSSSGELPTGVVSQGEFEVHLGLQGELKAVESVSLSAPDLNGQAKVTMVIEEGTRVEEGDVLLQFDTTELETTLENARNDYKIAMTKIDQAEAQLEVRIGDLENEVVRADLSLKRAEMRVTESETVPLVDRESAKLDVQESTLSAAKSRSALRSGLLEGEAELELLALDAARAQSRVEDVEKRIESATLTAPSPGLVILPEIWKGGSRGPIAAGDTIWGGSTVLTLPDLSEMEVIAWVHEVDAARVATEQTVDIVIDAHPDPSHSGTVERVADLAVRRDRNKKVKHLKVTIGLDDTTELMKPGMTVRAEVLVDRRTDVLSVPLEAIFDEDGETFVFAESMTGYRRIDVELGIANDTHVIVTSGLDSGDIVALVDPERFRSGEPTPPGKPGGGAVSASE